MKFTLLFICLSFIYGINAQVRVSNEKEVIEIKAGELNYYIPSENKEENVAQIALKISDFTPVNSSMVNLGFETKSVWFHLRTKNTSNSNLIRYLRLGNPIIDEVDVYKRIGTNTYVLLAKGGDQRPFHWREDGSRELLFKLNLDAQTENDFLFRVNNGGEQFYFKSTLEKQTHIQVKQAQNQVFYGLLFGVMIFIILLNLAIGILFRQRIAYIYTFYGISFTLLQLSLLGFGTTWLWTDQFFWSNRANPVLATLGVYFFLNFTYRFLELKTYTPKLKIVVRILQFSLLTNLIISLIPGATFMNISALLVNALTLLLNLLIIYPLVITLRAGHRPAKAYLIAFSLLQIGVFAFVLRNFGIIENTFIAENGLQIGSAAEMLILTFGILQRFKQLNDEALSTLAEANLLKEELNVQLEAEVEARTIEVIKQRNELEFKNQEITDSIEYAKRIQQAILPSPRYYRELIPHLEVFYRPKDIVAGDFYWIKRVRIGDEIWRFVAVADCTGHGVPGAMLSVLCTNALNESSRIISKPSPAELLERVNSYLKDYLQDDDTQLADGMDISIACFKGDFSEVYWAGANNPLWVLDNNELEVYTPTKRPVGKTDSALAFIDHKIEVRSSSTLVLFTDGCVDQFGGPNGKKLKSSGFKNLVIESTKENLTKQAKQIESELLKWMGNEEQLDDICFMLIACRN